MYTISHPDRYGSPIIDLSKDKEAQIGSKPLLTEAQVKLERVILKVFTTYNVPLEITDKIRAAFKSKLWRMGKCLSKLGGTKRQKQIQSWKDGKDSIWSLTIDATEASRQMLKRNQQVEEQLCKEVSKCHDIELENKMLRSEAATFHSVMKKQADTIVHLRTGRSEGGRGTSSKTWSQYSRQQRNEKKKILAGNVQAALSFREKHWIPVTVELVNVETSCREVLNMEDGNFSKVKSHTTLTENDRVRIALYIKDKFSLSDEAYREMSFLTRDIPRLYKVKEVAKDLNSKFAVLPAPEGVIGVQQSLRSRLMVRLRSLPSMERNQTIQIKLSGDGTGIAKHINVVNFTFTLLNEGAVASTAQGNHTLAILLVPEKYESLSGALREVAKEASELQTITLNDASYAIEYFLGGDMKFLSLVCGIDAANSEYACPWCKCSSAKRWDMNQDWSAFDQTKGARTIEEIKRFAALPKSRKRYNCSRNPLFEFIPIDHVIIDTLHLFLRISDILINLLIQDLRRQDGIEKSISKFDRGKSCNLSRYESFLNEKCQVHFQWYVSQDTKKLQWRDLSGPEKVRLFHHVDLPDLFPSLPNVQNIQHIWVMFWSLYIRLKKAESGADELQSDIKEWVRDFLTVYQTKNVTPYMHSFANHAPEFIKHYGDVAKFTQEGLEKLNDITTKHYQRSTNHRDQEALRQVLEKRNRIEDLEDSGYARKRRKIMCSVCGESGHNRRSCVRRPLQDIGNNVA